MTQEGSSAFHLNRPAGPVPTKAQFDPHDGDSDAQWAWKNFGGLSLAQAYDLFLTNPLCRQEDFMFMGTEAFDFYFPVIDRYLREVTGDEEGNDCEAWILGQGIISQLSCKQARLSDSLVMEIERLVEFVRANLERYSPSIIDQQRIERAWIEVHNGVGAWRNIRANPPLENP